MKRNIIHESRISNLSKFNLNTLMKLKEFSRTSGSLRCRALSISISGNIISEAQFPYSLNFSTHTHTPHTHNSWGFKFPYIMQYDFFLT